MKIASFLKHHYAGVFYLFFITTVAVITAYVFDYSLFGTVGTLFSLGFITAIAFYWILFCVASVNRYIFMIFTVAWFLFLKLLHSAVIANDVNIESADSLASALKSTISGNYDFFNFAYLQEALSYLGAAVLIGLIYFLFARRFKAWKRMLLALSAVALLVLVFPWQKTTVGKIPANYQTVQNGFVSLENMNRLKNDVVTVKPLNSLDNIEVVLVVPDSVRKNNLSINGYAKPTTPYMKEYDFISFSKAYSCDYTDTSSLLCMFTKNPEGSLEVNTPEAMKTFRLSQNKSLLSLFKSAGFSTAWLSSYPLSVAKDNAHLSSLAMEADKSFFSVIGNGFDTQLLPMLEKALADANPRKFIVLRIKGAMAPYYERYPADKEEFKPVCQKEPTSCYSAEAVVNTYDNAMKETDFFLAGVVEKLKERPALLIFAANHGEMLGEGGLYGHNGEAAEREEVRLPALAVWVSPKLENDLRIKDIIRANAEKAFDYTSLFTSIADCAGLKSDILNQEQSFCRKNMQSSAYVEGKLQKNLSQEPIAKKETAPAEIDATTLPLEVEAKPETAIVPEDENQDTLNQDKVNPEAVNPDLPLPPEVAEPQPESTPQSFEEVAAPVQKP